jgi:hypothetical protein
LVCDLMHVKISLPTSTRPPPHYRFSDVIPDINRHLSGLTLSLKLVHLHFIVNQSEATVHELTFNTNLVLSLCSKLLSFHYKTPLHHLSIFLMVN